MSDLQLITTADGSHSLFHAQLDETYHSKYGAIQESNHVFIHHGLQYWVEKTNRNSVSIFEVGFGTGLNAWLTYQFARRAGVQVHYHTVEAFPLPREIWMQLNYAAHDATTFSRLHEAQWDVDVEIDNTFTLRKHQGTLQEMALQGNADVIYFDAFAPGKQPDLWAFGMLEKVCRILTASGVFVTYCARGQLKRDLRTLTLVTETLPGPPGKKEMVRAIRK